MVLHKYLKGGIKEAVVVIWHKEEVFVWFSSCLYVRSVFLWHHDCIITITHPAFISNPLARKQPISEIDKIILGLSINRLKVEGLGFGGIWWRGCRFQKTKTSLVCQACRHYRSRWENTKCHIKPQRQPTCYVIRNRSFKWWNIYLFFSGDYRHLY